MSNSNNILLLVKKHNEKLVTKYTNRINELEAENRELNKKLSVLTNENETLKKESDTTIDLLTQYFDSLDSNSISVNHVNVSPVLFETPKTVQFSPDVQQKPLFSPPYKYLPRRHKAFLPNKRMPLVKKFEKYKASKYQDSSDSDEEVTKPLPSPDHVPVENTPINVLKKILTDDFSTVNNTNKDAPYSFNNMKPYIFTLDKNNKK